MTNSMPVHYYFLKVALFAVGLLFSFLTWSSDTHQPSARMRSYCHSMGCDYRVFYDFFYEKQRWFCAQRPAILKGNNIKLLRLVASIAERSGVHGSVAVLPLMESSLNSQANQHLSMKSAKGFWQLLPGTAKDMGLHVSSGNDERLDIAKSTKAALSYLKMLNDRYQDHNLAVMAYNAGLGRVDRLIEEHNTRNPWFLSRVMLDTAPDQDYLMKYYSYTLIILGEGCTMD